MKPVVRRYRAATQVNVVSSEIVVVEEADSVSWLESSMQSSVIGEAGCAPPGSQTVARYRMEYDGTWESLCVPLVRGTFRECADKQPVPMVSMPNHVALRSRHRRR
jgi:hypothetical protein